MTVLKNRAIWLGTLLTLTVATSNAEGHCDTLSGPLVTEARRALEKGNVTPLLKWVKKEREAEIKQAFKRTLAVRGKGVEARALADHYFFETLVRIHRAAEGAAYTGLKSKPPEPVVAKADQALERGSVDALAKAIARHVEQGVRARFHHALDARKSAAASVEAGRKFVRAYVLFTHYVEGVHALAAGAEHRVAGMHGH